MKRKSAKRKVAAKKVVKRKTVKKLTMRQIYDLARQQMSRERRMFVDETKQMSIRLQRIEVAQRSIERNIDLIINDYIRHPLKVDGMNQQAFRSLVDRASREHPEMFHTDFDGRLKPNGH